MVPSGGLKLGDIWRMTVRDETGMEVFQPRDR
jgi:hypothetical protein